MTRQGIGRGKLILFGEHAAVYGHPAVGTPLPWTTRLEWHAPRRSVSSDGSVKGVQCPDEHGEDHRVFLSLLDDLGHSEFLEGIWYRRSDIPRTGGFGSSAALCTAMARVRTGSTGHGYERRVHELANRLERRFHGTPSGIDTGMACDDGPAAWLAGGTGLPERRPLRFPTWHLLYGALPRTGNTASTVGSLRQNVDSGDAATVHRLADLGGIASDVINLVDSGDASADSSVFARRMGDAANEAQAILAGLGLSSPHLDVLLRLAQDSGAAGGKLSGGGLGGAFWIGCFDRPSRDRLLAELPEKLNRSDVRLAYPLTPLDLGP